MKTVLVVAAHPDDEILGVGGTVARHVAEGDVVYALILGEGRHTQGRCRQRGCGRASLQHFGECPCDRVSESIFCGFSRQSF